MAAREVTAKAKEAVAADETANLRTGAVRSYPTGRYVVLYQPADEVLEIVRVRHGATKLDELFEVE